MSKLLKIAMGAAVLCSLVAGQAFAGLNAGATGKIGWLGGNNKYLPTTNSVDCLPVLGITAKGLHNLRGADVQLYLNGAGGNLPPSWQWWTTASDQGCAVGFQTVAVGFNSTGLGAAVDSIYNGFLRAPAIPGVATGQNGAMYYNQGPCLTPHGVGLLWFSATGTAGSVRAPGANWGLFSILMKQNQGACPGDCDDTPESVCFSVQFRQPCSDAGNPRGAVLGVIDGGLSYDFAPCQQSFLTWNGDPQNTCPGVTSTRTGSWGALKKTYR